MLSALHKFLHSLRTAMPRPFIRPLVSMPVLTPRINFRYLKNSTWSIPINPNQKTCYCNAQINFQEQHNRSDISKTWTPIMSQQMANQKTYQRRTPKKELQYIFSIKFCHLLTKTLDSDPIQSFSESYHQGRHPEVAMSWMKRCKHSNVSPPESRGIWFIKSPKKMRGTWNSAIHPSYLTIIIR